MDQKLEQAIKCFMDNLESVNELHHPNDYKRLYNIALIATLNGTGVPYDELKEAFDKDKFFRETGKLGGVKSANLRRENDVLGPCVARAVIGGDLVSEMLKGILDEFDKPQKSCKGDGAKNKADFPKS